MNTLSIVLCKDAADAIAKGHVYTHSGVTPLKLKTAVVVQNGTVGGNATVDLVLEDLQGKKYVAVITGNLLKSIPL